MQRKMKLIRRILEYTETSTSEERFPIPEFDEYTEPEVHYHVGLCEEAGFLVLYQPTSTGLPRRFPGIVRLTWKGHEALDGMRQG